MNLTITGKLATIEDTKSVGSFNKFDKRRCVVYSSSGPMPIDFMYDDTSLLDEYKAGDRVKVVCVLEGREWTSPGREKQYFLSLKGVTITLVNENNSKKD